MLMGSFLIFLSSSQKWPLTSKFKLLVQLEACSTLGIAHFSLAGPQVVAHILFLIDPPVSR